MMSRILLLFVVKKKAYLPVSQGLYPDYSNLNALA
jgi:hypothetical protein